MSKFNKELMHKYAYNINDSTKGKKVKIDSMNRVLQKYKLDINDDEADAINICEAFCIKSITHD